MNPTRFKRLIPGVSRSPKSVCIYWPTTGTHPDFAVVFAWISWSHRGEIGRPRNISGNSGAYWHWPLGLGFVDWWGQWLNVRALRVKP